MSFTKIDTNTDFIGRGAMSLADQPTISASELKRKFDEPAREVVTPKFNNLIDELEATTSAASLGAVAPTGRTGATVQAVVNSVSADLATLEGSVAQVIADDHTHANKALLDTYTQTETDLADAVAKKHDHSNKALLDTYTQTDADLAQAVADDHTHTNKTVLDKFSEVGGDPYYDGNPIGGGGSGDTFKTIESGGTSFVASGEDTFKINAGSNVTIEALSSPDKGIKISAAGGGTSTGDMLMSDYDDQGNVKTAGGIEDYVASVVGGLDGSVTGTPGAGKTLTAFSETDGVVSATFSNISITKSQVSDFPTIPDELNDLNDCVINTPTEGQALIVNSSGKFANANLPTGGHQMIAVADDIATLQALANGNDNYVINAYTAKRWSNVDGLTLYTTAAKDTDTIGDWEDNWTGSGASRSGWLWHKALFKILSNDYVKGEPVFDVKDGEVVSIYAYRIDDEIYVAVDNPSGNPQEQGWYESDGQTPPTYTLTTDTTVQVGKTYYVGGGAIAIKLNGAIQNNDGVDIGIELSTKRFASVQFETL